MALLRQFIPVIEAGREGIQPYQDFTNILNRVNRCAFYSLVIKELWKMF